ncbi:MAG: NAD(+) diphosphatase [Aliivibrio sp.]|uniref:NAD(+) diphosphatase n=1 Tax=Aliivibrio sp. TaxID=1872443 RepID=UPI001A526FC1|nr:NAD(+) diphosphatase [Aliivibrio sp.]
MLKVNENAYWCVVNDSELWLENGLFPLGSADSLSLPIDKAVVIGQLNNLPVVWINDDHVDYAINFSCLRTLLVADTVLFELASRAIQFGHMVRTQRFCPLCGGRNSFNHNQLAMQCGECRTLHYPRIFPCIIVSVRKGNQILLAQHTRHKGGLYTVLAGFVEVGETLEQCVIREVKEETGIDVGNIRYIGSQPWAFPSSLMMAFQADYVGGQIQIDKTELCSAGWYGNDDLPDVAPEGTIARALINKTLTEIEIS